MRHRVLRSLAVAGVAAAAAVLAAPAGTPPPRPPPPRRSRRPTTVTTGPGIAARLLRNGSCRWPSAGTAVLRLQPGPDHVLLLPVTGGAVDLTPSPARSSTAAPSPSSTSATASGSPSRTSFDTSTGVLTGRVNRTTPRVPVFFTSTCPRRPCRPRAARSPSATSTSGSPAPRLGALTSPAHPGLRRRLDLGTARTTLRV